MADVKKSDSSLEKEAKRTPEQEHGKNTKTKVENNVSDFGYTPKPPEPMVKSDIPDFEFTPNPPVPKTGIEGEN